MGEAVKKVGDLTIPEFQSLIKETLLELVDPDHGMELRPEVEAELKEALAQKDQAVPLSEAKKRFGSCVVYQVNILPKPIGALEALDKPVAARIIDICST